MYISFRPSKHAPVRSLSGSASLNLHKPSSQRDNFRFYSRSHQPFFRKETKPESKLEIVEELENLKFVGYFNFQKVIPTTTTTTTTTTTALPTPTITPKNGLFTNFENVTDFKIDGSNKNSTFTHSSFNLIRKG